MIIRKYDVIFGCYFFGGIILFFCTNVIIADDERWLYPWGLHKVEYIFAKASASLSVCFSGLCVVGFVCCKWFGYQWGKICTLLSIAFVIILVSFFLTMKWILFGFG